MCKNSNFAKLLPHLHSVPSCDELGRKFASEKNYNIFCSKSQGVGGAEVEVAEIG